MTPSVSTRWMHGKLLVAQTLAAAINLQILSFDETDTRSSSKKTNVGDAAIFSEGSHYAEAIDGTRFLCVDGARPRDRRTTQDTNKFRRQRAIVSGQLSALIGVGFASLVAKS